MVQITSAQHAKTYFSQSLRQSDYYINGQEQELRGHFYGQLAMRLGVDAKVTPEVFHAFCDNRHFITGKRLTQRDHAFRRIGYDINYHCPKSVSALHVLSKDNHILDAFRESVNETMQDIESDALTRVRKGKDKNCVDNRKTGELIWSEFIHQTARPIDGMIPDMHLHAHCLTFNVTWDKQEEYYKAGEFGHIKRDMPYYQARFHKRLSDKLIALGYRIRRTDTSFEVEGVPQAVIDLFSKRTNEIGQTAKKLGITDAKELDKLGSRTRGKKQKGLSMSELKAAWRKQIYDLGMDKQGDGKTVIRYGQSQELQNLTAGGCIDFALKQRFERASVMDGRRILETAYRHAMGNLSVNVDGITNAFEQDDRIIRVPEHGREKCSTREVLVEEQRMVQLARDGKGASRPLYAEVPPMALDGGQAEAVSHLLTTADQVSIIQGRAGTGKTTLMKEAIRLIEQTGYTVTVVAPTSEASRGVLRNEGFSGAETVAMLLSSQEMQDRLKNNVLWVDEAGLLGTKDMSVLLALAKAQSARLVLSGDTRQHGSVVRGDAMRILNSVAGIKSAQVSKIYRQRNCGYKKAVQALADGDTRTGFDRLQEMGAIKEIGSMSPVSSLVEDYVATITNKKTALVVSPTHQQGDQVTDEIRKRLRDIGMIGSNEARVIRLINRNLTEAERQDWRSYKAGQVVQFTQNTTGFGRGSKWTVQHVCPTEITLADNTGKQALLPLGDANRFEVFFATEIGLSSGDHVRITRNGIDRNGKRLNNGQRLNVSGVDENGQLQFCNPDSGSVYTLPSDYGHIAHAYCVTSHASQGKTVDEVFIYQPVATFAASDRKQFYVSVSRGRDAVHVYTDDTKQLLAAASESGDRISALELLVKRKHDTRERAEDVARQSVVTAPHKSADMGSLSTHPITNVRLHEPMPG